MGRTTYESQDFEVSGPSIPSAFDWENPHHRRSTAACLTQGVYVLERDRQQERRGPESLAPRWWESFHFELLKLLFDDKDGSIFGAIYQYKYPNVNDESGRHSNKDGSPPQYVIAFRGNIINEPETFVRDLRLDLKLGKHGLHQTSRFNIGMKAVAKKVAANGHRDVWVTGHSLGAAIAMLIGRKIAKTNIFLQAFLFNPPFISAVENIKHEKVKSVFQVGNSLVTAGLTVAIGRSSQLKSKSEEFVALSNWKPCLFVNPADPICVAYVGYFERRKMMKKLGLEKVEKRATQNSKRELVLRAIGRKPEAFHLIPSANLTTNSTPNKDFEVAHGLEQWWGPDSCMSSKLHEYS